MNEPQPLRIKELWNSYFLSKNPALATADVRLIEEEEVLETPFISGRKLDPKNSDDLGLMGLENDAYIQKYSRGLLGWNKSGNIIYS